MKRLPQEAKKILQEWYPDLNLEEIKLKENTLVGAVFAEVFSAAAITIGKTIHLTKYSWLDWQNPMKPDGLALLIHELKHIEQQKKMGALRFYFQYIVIDFPRCFLVYCWQKKTLNFIKALKAKYEWKLPLEEPAFAIGKEFLRKTEEAKPRKEGSDEQGILG